MMLQLFNKVGAAKRGLRCQCYSSGQRPALWTAHLTITGLQPGDNWVGRQQPFQRLSTGRQKR